MIEDVRIVLVETSHPGNIGAVARAMKNMGLKRLFLVDPKVFPSALATERSAGADDILEHAQVVPTLREAISDCELVFGASARVRQIPWPTVNPRQTAEQVCAHPNPSKIAVVFGTERSGLTNDALSQCHYHTVIPANPNYESLNLAQAVQVITYELYQSYLNQTENSDKNKLSVVPVQAPLEDIFGVFDHMESVLDQIDFLTPKSSRVLIYRIKRMILKTKLETEEVNILRGIFKAVLRKLSAKSV